MTLLVRDKKSRKKKDWGLGKKSSFRVYKKRDQRRSLGRENWGAEREIR